MKLKTYILFFLLIGSTRTFSQGSVDGVSIAPVKVAPDKAAMLDIQAADKGMLIPRMTQSEMNAITPGTGADGLQVFVNDGEKNRGFWMYEEPDNKWVRYGIDIDKLLPVGVIFAFDLTTGCPPGWIAFADAEGRFLIGDDGDKYTLNLKGGEATVVLQVANIPNHDHTFVGSVSAGTTNSVSHAHNIYTRSSGTDVAADRDAEFGKKSDLTATTPLEGNNTQPSTHSHTASGTVTGSIGNNSALKGELHENMPPYYTIIYCRRNF